MNKPCFSFNNMILYDYKFKFLQRSLFMRHHKSIMLSAIAASFIVTHGGGALCARYQ